MNWQDRDYDYPGGYFDRLCAEHPGLVVCASLLIFAAAFLLLAS